MPRYFMRDTPLRAMELMMMSQPGHKPRGGGMYRRQFYYTPKDVECEYCQNYDRKHPCLLCECACLEERIEACVLNLSEFVQDCFAPSMEPQLQKRMCQQFGEEKSHFSYPTLTAEDGHTGERSAGVCLTEIKLPFFYSRLMRAFGEGWSGSAVTTALTSKLFISEKSSQSFTAFIRRQRPLR